MLGFILQILWIFVYVVSQSLTKLQEEAGTDFCRCNLEIKVYMRFWDIRNKGKVFCCNFEIFPTFSIAFLQPTHLADFNQVQTIQYSNSEDKDRKGMLQLKIAGAPEVGY